MHKEAISHPGSKIGNIRQRAAGEWDGALDRIGI